MSSTMWKYGHVSLSSAWQPLVLKVNDRFSVAKLVFFLSIRLQHICFEIIYFNICQKMSGLKRSNRRFFFLQFPISKGIKYLNFRAKISAQNAIWTYKILKPVLNASWKFPWNPEVHVFQVCVFSWVYKMSWPNLSKIVSITNAHESFRSKLVLFLLVIKLILKY